MAKEVRPFPCNKPVEPFKGDHLELNDNELALFDSIAQEHVRIAGTKIEYFSLNITGSKRDPLYDEPVERTYAGPFVLKGFVEYPAITSETGEMGMQSSWRASVWLARKEVEDARLPKPHKGDVLRVWKTPFFDKFGVNDLNAPNIGYYFDVVEVKDDGHLFDTSSFVGLQLTITRRTEFTPERRLQP